jgi:hypothetical protein
MGQKKKKSLVSQVKKGQTLALLHSGLPTKGNVKNTALETLKDLVVGVVAGGLAGAAIGKPSLIVGLGVTGAGHYFDQRLATIFGLGMMAAGGYQTVGLKGLDGLDGAKERVMAFKDTLTEKLYIDKIIKKNAAAGATTSGFGELQYFNYDQMSGTADLSEMNGELAALNNIERQIEESGVERMQMTGAYETDMSGAYDTEISGPGDVAEYNL